MSDLPEYFHSVKDFGHFPWGQLETALQCEAEGKRTPSLPYAHRFLANTHKGHPVPTLSLVYEDRIETWNCPASLFRLIEGQRKRVKEQVRASLQQGRKRR